jgi:hypothetical protein
VQILLAILFLLVKGCGNSQSKNPADIISFAKSSMAKPFSAVKGSVKCTSITESNECRSFNFQPEDKNIRLIANIEFPALILDTDSLKLVNSISWYKSYKGKDSTTTKSRFITDNTNIKEYLKKLLNAEGAEGEGYKDEYYTSNITKWLFDSFNIILDASTYFKRGNQNEFSVMAIYIVKKEP